MSTLLHSSSFFRPSTTIKDPHNYISIKNSQNIKKNQLHNLYLLSTNRDQTSNVSFSV
ncbi:hypothetical protein PGT21_033298 [Puccinia graminis f. sp. tritici]|uniref:Uncharacterized protein n=1 Tax=Puccinia graminis f. sp. tritici TaxID=56615 RepID=A0A5B0QCN0_PUCGR|nr:hypothetical protein PGT21_033298 [Puccinia graminis f. sp. tritici]